MTADAKVLSTGPLPHDEARWTKLVKINYCDPTGTPRTWESAERTTRNGGLIDGVGIVAILTRPPPLSSSSHHHHQHHHGAQTNGAINTHDDNGNTTNTTTAITTSRTGDGTTTSTTTAANNNNTTTNSGPHIVLQKQYRPPINKICIEVPAGLIDANETPEVAALRELAEETGYIGTILSSSSSDPNSSSSSSTLDSTPLMFNDPGFCNTNLKMVHVSVDMDNPLNQNPKPRLEDGEFIETFTVELGRLWEECKRFEREGYAIDARIGGLAEGIEMAKKFGLR